MNFTIEDLIKKYSSNVKKEQTTPSTERSKAQRVKQNRLQRIGQIFICLLAEISSTDKDAEVYSQQKIKEKTEQFIKIKSEQRNIRENQMKKIIGEYVEDEFINTQCFKGLREQFQRIIQDNNKKIEVPQEKIESPYKTPETPQKKIETPEEKIETPHQNSEEQEHDYRTLLSNLHQNASNKKQTIAKSQFEFEAEQYFQNTPHWKEVINYLTEIKSPQTQLSYLCQSMGWRLNFRDGVIKGMFEVIVEVNFQYKKTEKLLKQSYSAQTKKIGRLVSSFKMLKNIYISFPQIWQLNEKKRSKNPINSQKQPTINKIIQPNIFYEKIQPISQIKQVDQHFNKDKDNYLKNITNFKTEMNLLNHQFPGVLTYKIDRNQIQVPGLTWVVKGHLIVKFKGTDKTFEGSQQNPSSKIAEENITRILVTSVYEEYKQILEKMIVTKNKKGTKA